LRQASEGQAAFHPLPDDQAKKLPPRLAESPPPQENSCLTQLRSLHQQPTPRGIEEFLTPYHQPHGITQATFKAGIQRFADFANLSPTQRRQQFGNPHFGLHYTNDLSKAFSGQVSPEKLSTLCPKSWRAGHNADSALSLVYSGKNPAQALDELIKGPSVIDCGMFTQLSLWFGIRHMLGDEQFNQLFGDTPFYLTQFNYNPQHNPNQPYTGNPLFDFLSADVPDQQSSIGVAYIQNHANYLFKHPAGDYAGENAIQIDGAFTIFDPHLADTRALSLQQVQRLLQQEFNAGPTQQDTAKLILYQQNPDRQHPLGHTFAGLTILAEALKDQKQEDPTACGQLTHAMHFDLAAFQKWTQTTLAIRQQGMPPASQDLTDEPSAITDPALREKIPVENREMTFAQFSEHATTPQQQRLLQTAQGFCELVMQHQPAMVVLSGQAGIGKTASAACCANFLAAQGKKVAWLSEVQLKAWTTEQTSMEALSEIKQEILQTIGDADVVILDDDNLSGYAGQSLLETIYGWYAQHTDKALFVTSNIEVTLQVLYGMRLDKTFDFPPQIPYTSPQYQHIFSLTNLAGPTLRAHSGFSRKAMDGANPLQHFLEYPVQTRSIGLIVSADEATQLQENPNVDYVPYIDHSEKLAPIITSLAQTGQAGGSYDELTQNEKKWIAFSWGTVTENRNGNPFNTGVPVRRINIRPFQASEKPTIALEIIDSKSLYFKNKAQHGINYFSFLHLLQIVNWAHNEGSKKIVLINKTPFSENELIEKILYQLPESEAQRTKDRLLLLLGI